MKKVLIFAPTAPSSGITQYLLNFLNYAQGTDISFDILSFQNNRLRQWAETHGTKYFELNISLYKHPFLYRQFLKNVFSRGYDVVHYHFSSISTLRPFLYAKQSGIKKQIMHSHACRVEVTSSLRRKVFTCVHKMLRPVAGKYFSYKLACSAISAKWMFGSEYNQAVVLNNAIDVDKFRFSEENRQALFEKYNLAGKQVIGHIGRFSYSKNHEFILQILSELQKRRKNVVLLLIGEGELKSRILQNAKAQNLSEAIRFIDFQEEIYKFYSAMDIYILPSLFESFGITLIEAQAAGLPCIASTAVIKETDLTGMVSFLPLESGAEAWAAELDKRLQNVTRVDEREKLVQSGFSIFDQIKEIVKFYK